MCHYLLHVGTQFKKIRVRYLVVSCIISTNDFSLLNKRDVSKFSSVKTIQ